jgi:hypothetical protein
MTTAGKHLQHCVVFLIADDHEAGQIGGSMTLMRHVFKIRECITRVVYLFQLNAAEASRHEVPSPSHRIFHMSLKEDGQHILSKHPREVDMTDLDEYLAAMSKAVREVARSVGRFPEFNDVELQRSASAFVHHIEVCATTYPLTIEES